MFFNKSSVSQSYVPEIITRNWLNDLLWEQGVLTEGRVSSVVLKRRFQHHHSNILFLHTGYSSDVVARLPNQWVLKIRTHSEGIVETEFFRQAVHSQRLNFLPSPGAYKSWDSGESVVLLENLKNTHKLVVTDQQVFNQCGWRPIRAVLELLVRALAQFHACWWNQPELEHLRIRSPDYDQNIATKMQLFKHQMHQEPELVKGVEWAKANVSQFFQRGSKSPVTLVHGDCYPWHFFLGRTENDVRLFDFEFAAVHSPAYDLVSLLSYWQGDYKRVFRQYHEHLVSEKIAGYEFDALMSDVKIAIAAHIIRSVQEWHRECSEALWKVKLNNLLQMQLVVDNIN